MTHRTPSGNTAPRRRRARPTTTAVAAEHYKRTEQQAPRHEAMTVKDQIRYTKEEESTSYTPTVKSIPRTESEVQSLKKEPRTSVPISQLEEDLPRPSRHRKESDSSPIGAVVGEVKKNWWVYLGILILLIGTGLVYHYWGLIEAVSVLVITVGFFFIQEGLERYNSSKK